VLEPPDESSCRATCLPVRLADRIPAVVVVPHVAGYPPDQVELVAPLDLRRELGLAEGDVVAVADGHLRDLDAVLFDVDGTLVNSLDGMWIAASRAAALYGYEVPRDAVRHALNTGQSLWHQIIPAADRHDSELPGILRMETLRHWPTVLAESVEVFAGLGELLAELRGAGLRLAIYTGSRGESLLPLARAGLLDLFDAVLTAADVDRPKPDPEGLVACLARLGCASSRAVYVGDSVHDVAAGQAAGMRTIGVLTGAASSASLAAAGADRIARDGAGLRRILLQGA
jgi:phosphoglycolate phosphatase-like HAD superfamily hydrolase